MSVNGNNEDKKGNDEDCKRKQWDECIRRSSKNIALGMVLGAVGSALMGGSDVPLRLATGFTVGLSVNRCRRLLNPPVPPAPPPKPEDPCTCCFSDFEPLIKDEFEDTVENKDQQIPKESCPATPPEEEPKCTCEESHYEWTTPAPADGEILEQLPQCTCEE